MGQCIVKRKSSLPEEGTKKIKQKAENQTDNNIKPLNEVNDNITTMSVKSLKFTSKFKKYPKKSKLEESGDKSVIKIPLNQSLIFITAEDTKIKLKSPGMLISKSTKINENSKSTSLNMSKHPKKTDRSTNTILKNNISTNHSKGIDKRIAFFQNLQEKSSNTKVPNLVTLKDISLNSNTSYSTTTTSSCISNLIKATTKNRETIFVSSKTIPISPKAQKANEGKIFSLDNKTSIMIKEKNYQVNKKVTNSPQLIKKNECKKDTMQVDGKRPAEPFHIIKQTFSTKKFDNKVKQEKRNEKVNNSNKVSHTVNKKESITERTITVLTKRVFRNGKWMEETTKTETLTDGKGTTKVGEKTSFRDLLLSELPNPERDTLKPAGMPDSVSSSTIRIPNNNRPQPGKVVAKRDHKPMVKDNPESFARQVMVATNSYRKLHGAPPLQLNNRLTKMAQEWADHLAKTEKMEHGDKKDVGENIYCKTSSQPWFEMSGSEVVDNWYSEVDEHDYNEEPKLGFLKTGHFTQLVWKDTKDLGIAFSRSKNGHMAFVVAYYSPKGNWIGEFKEQVLPAGAAQRSQIQNTSKSKVKISESKNQTKTTKTTTTTTTQKSSNRKKTDRYKLPEVERVRPVPILTSRSRPVTPNTIPDSAESRAADSPLSYTSRASIFTPRTANDSADVRAQSRRNSEFQSPVDSLETRVYDLESPVSRTTTRNDRQSDPDYQTPPTRSGTRANSADTPNSVKSNRSEPNYQMSNGVDTPASIKSNISDPTSQSPIRTSATRVTTVSPPIKGKTTSPPTRLTSFSPSSSVADKNFYADCLNAHNYYRERHGVDPLTIDDKLCKYAQEWAEKIAKEDMMDHREDNEYGENIYMKWTSDTGYTIPGEEAVDSWYEEIHDYEFGREPTDLSAGHFTQVIWSDSKKLGAGVAKSISGKIYVVANYEPPGNYLGQFSKKVPPPL